MARLTIGLTGGLASGKTTVLGFFRHLGVDTYSADTMVHRFMAKNGCAYPTIIDHFGHNILTKEKEIDKKKLREIIFNSGLEKNWLENYLHPLVRNSLLTYLNNATACYAVVEIPLLIEAKTPFTMIDRILVVDAEVTTQQHYAQQRSGLSSSESQAIIAQQASRQERNKKAHDIIINHGDLIALERQVKKLHQQYLAISHHCE